MADWVKVLDKTAIAEGKLHRVVVSGEDIVLGVLDGRPFAIENVCSHQEYPLHDGSITPAGKLKCRYHGVEFNPFTGDALNNSAVFPVRAYNVELREDGIYVLF